MSTTGNGLSTKEALSRLARLIRNTKRSHNARSSMLLKDLFSLPSHEMVLLLFYILSLTLLITAYFIQPGSRRQGSDLCLVFIALAVLLSSFILIVRRTDRSNQIRSVQILSKILDQLLHELPEGISFYPKFYIPPHLASSFQLTFRDNHLVVVPTLLLVPGDVILVNCEQDLSVQYTPIGASSDGPQMKIHSAVNFADPLIEKLKPTIKALVNKAPFEDFLAHFHAEAHSQHSMLPSSFSSFIFRILCLSFYLKLLLLIIFVLSLCVHISVQHDRDTQFRDNLNLSSSILKLVGRFLLVVSGIGLTPMWLCAVSISLAHSDLRLSKRLSALHSDLNAESSDSSSSLHRSTASIASEEHGASSRKDAKVWTRNDLLNAARLFWSRLYASPDAVLEQYHLSLGEVSSVCCVNQEGILSRPIPTPDKLFFFRRRHSRHRHSLQRTQRMSHDVAVTRTPSSTRNPRRKFNSHNQSEQFSTNSPFDASVSGHRASRVVSMSSFLDEGMLMHDASNSRVVPIILDMCTDSYWPFIPHFEKPRWTRYLNSLKPIGLSLMLNNDHVPLVNESRDAIINHLINLDEVRHATGGGFGCPERLALMPFCLCGLAKQIGFNRLVMQDFTPVACIEAYRYGLWPSEQVPCLASAWTPEPIEEHDQEERLLRTIALSHLPVSSCFSAIFQQATTPTPTYQVMSQGTGDMLANLCTDLWDGYDICNVGTAERRAMLDFYNRHASAAFCIGLAYAPVSMNKSLRGKTFFLRYPENFQFLQLQPTSVTGTASNTPRPSSCPRSCETPVRSRMRWSDPCADDIAPEVRSSLTDCSNILSEGNHPLENSTLEDVEEHQFDGDAKPGVEAPSVDEPTVDDLRTILEGQTFLGLLSLQYQANLQVVETIRRLGQACVRFVYFSRENSLRTRVFAERLGLECGWNCHISLAATDVAYQSTNFVNAAMSAVQLRNHEDEGEHVFTRQEKIPSSLLPPADSIEPMRAYRRSLSAPVVPPLNTSPHPGPLSPPVSDMGMASQPLIIPMDDGISVSSASIVLGEMNNNYRPSDESSTSTAPIEDDQDVTSRLFTYAVENKSRLPCGIENIRPHLANVDNVPLQVSLFTDCTPSSTYEMLTILQEHGETVCTVGNVFDVRHAPLFARGDVSILFCPVLPRPCLVFEPPRTPDQKNSPDSLWNGFSRDPTVRQPMTSKPTDPLYSPKSSQPITTLDLVVSVVRLCTPWVFDMETDGFKVYELLHEAHATVNNLNLVLTFAVWAPLTAALLQVLLSLVALPSLPTVDPSVSNPLWLPLRAIHLRLLPSLNQTTALESLQSSHYDCISGYGPGQLIWILFVVTPSLSLSMLDRQVERQRPLREPPVKRSKAIDRRKVARNALFLALRFVPSVLVCFACTVCHFLWPRGFDSCEDHVINLNLSTISNGVITTCPVRLSLLIQLVNEVVFAQFVIYLVLISFSYANFGQPIWKFRWSTNRCWSVFAAIIIGSQLIYTICQCFLWDPLIQSRRVDVLSICSTIGGLVWIPLLIFFNEAVGLRERRIIRAEHRLARLFFGTKLGMYSPV